MSRRYHCVAVTGASSGLGAAFAEQLALQADHLVLIGRDRDRLELVAQKLARECSVEIYPCDLSDTEALDALALHLSAKPVDCLVNNAGYADDGSFDQMDWQRHLALLKVHVEAVTRLCYAVLPFMVGERRGDIINVSSIVAWLPTPHSPLYGPTKAYILSLSESLALAYQAKGIRVMSLNPNFIQTLFHSRLGLDPSQFYRKHGLLKAWDPHVIAQRALRSLKRNQITCIPAWNYLILAKCIQWCPRKLLLWLLARHTLNERYNHETK